MEQQLGIEQRRIAAARWSVRHLKESSYSNPPRLVLLALLLALALGGLGANLLVVLLEGGQVLAGLGELALLHALADPVRKLAA